VTALVIGGMLILAPAASAGYQSTPPKDYSDTALNIIPSGQFGTVPPPAGADTQAKMYDGLTPQFDDVTNADLTQYFKSEKYGISTAGPGTTESVPRPGVTIVRDSYDVPHVTATTHDGGVWAAGWIAAEDRGLLLQQARYNARVAAIDAPGLDAVDLIASLQSFKPSEQTEAVVANRPRYSGTPAARARRSSTTSTRSTTASTTTWRSTVHPRRPSRATTSSP
jgi:hypothetical protein